MSRISGTHMAICSQNTSAKSFDVWMGDVQRGLTSPFLVSPSGELDPQWSPEDEIAFSSDRNGPMAIFRKSNGPGEPVKVVDAAEAIFLSDVPDAKRREGVCAAHVTPGRRPCTIP